ncbi:hypothetical protein MFMK1_001356 [Metallumcola ferriviriculae]|uniref:ABC transporter permease n=1 Tax=Metallumcola ferriviriculae TaxID=3039180 RepID=A0AAU0UMX8_9FIRM|nr:hypothetical protein MFMK1_001356 [Desulfitibacteraceae bacterium MK1]
MNKVFMFVVIIHGLIHLMGFAKAFNLAEISELTQDISKPQGVLWLAAAVLFLITAVIFILKNETWWMPAIAAIIISQVLIVSSWQDAKFGTLANVIMLIVIKVLVW